MKFTLRIALAMAGTALMPLVPAMAADYDPPIYVDQAPEYVPVEVGSGWYLRGDIAYLPKNGYKNTVMTSPDIRLSEKERPVFGSLGFGYHFNDYARADVNFGILSGNKAGLAVDLPTAMVAAAVKNSGRTAIVNGYVDLGTYVGLTPYVGAGIGVFQARYSASRAVDDLTPADLDVSDSIKKTQYSWAYTLNAGVGYQLSKNVMLDLGYQYMSAPDANYAQVNAASGYTLHKGVDNHQIKVGLRYDLW